MKRVAVAISDVCAWDNLACAFYRAAAGKRHSAAVRSFIQDFDARLARIADHIIRLDLPVSDFRRFVIHDPKKRIIHAPSFEDRVIHHAVMNPAGPVLDRAMTDYSFACRKGKGVHAAVRQVQTHLCRYQWYVKIDIESYFDTVDHNRLLALLSRKFKGKAFLSLLEKIVTAYHTRPGKGLPIGTLTSQHFANFYLDRLDRFVMESCRARACVRYMDDMIFWCDTKASARLLLKKVRLFVETPLLLTVKNSQVQIRKSNCGVLFCGYRIYPGVIRLSYGKKQWVVPANGREPCVARRFLEQQRQGPAVCLPEQEHAFQPEQQHWLPPGPSSVYAGGRQMTRAPSGPYALIKVRQKGNGRRYVSKSGGHRY